ncbi:MAG: iron-sulfur cluster-binding domain-containing protein, partial [Microbacterium sp.]
TPLRAMVETAHEAGADWTLDYAGRSRSSMAFAHELADRFAARVRLHPADEGARLDVAVLAAQADAGTDVYVCGPARLLTAVEAAMAGSAGALHLERFEAVEYGDPVWPGPFDVELAMTGTTVVVAPEQTVLEAIEEQSPETVVLSSCRRGTCGTCEVPVLEGEIEHRDSVLTPFERADNAVMMACVSRAACPRIVLDL